MITRKLDWGEIQFNEESHRYKLVPGGQVPGTSTVAKIVGDGIPPWWGMKIGVKGAVRLAALGEFKQFEGEVVGDHTVDAVIGLMKERNLTVNDARDEAGFRGTAVHRYIAQDPRPDIEEFAPNERPYIRSFLQWEQEEQPTYLAFEQMVAHPEEKFAGTYDARVRLGDRECLLDWKTSKRVYTEMHYQLAGYELAARACGENPTDAQYVIRLKDDGSYPEVVRCEATTDDFTIARDLYHSRNAVEKRIKQAKRDAASPQQELAA